MYCTYTNMIYAIIVFYIASERPSIKEIILQISPLCFNRWFDLGIILDISVQKLRDIRLSVNIKPDAYCIRMFTEWLEGDVNPTWNTLSKAINSVLAYTTILEELHIVNFCEKG